MKRNIRYIQRSKRYIELNPKGQKEKINEYLHLPLLNKLAINRVDNWIKNILICHKIFFFNFISSKQINKYFEYLIKYNRAPNNLCVYRVYEKIGNYK